MHTSKSLFFTFVLLVSGVSSSLAGMSTQVGIGYGREFRENRNLEQCEIFWRYPLPYKRSLGDTWNLSTDLALAAALISEEGGDDDGTGRFSLMAQVFLSPHDMVNFILGFGTGFMVGSTEYGEGHDLGGNFLFNAKVGVQILLGGHWGFEYVYYHQSNAGIYETNDGLSMNQLAFTYNF